ncbi:hypothetical protein THIX_10096 [Thiomonas sp. X19]|nr:hypothetical protein THIX_10096 [Thiomonas sp. X19]
MNPEVSAQGVPRLKPLVQWALELLSMGQMPAEAECSVGASCPVATDLDADLDPIFASSFSRFGAAN